MNRSETYRVIVIEADPLDYQLVRRALAKSERGEFQLHHAQDLFQAYGYLASSRADVALLDLHLKASSGLETLRAFREHVPGLPVIVLSGDDQMDTALASLGEGAHDYLVKGEFTEPILSRAICYAMERARLQKRLDDAELRLGPMIESVTICSDCKSVKDDLGFWGALEEFIGAYMDTAVSTATCPSCAGTESEAA